VCEKKAIRDLINRVNGKLRTPKIHRLEKLIDWYNTTDPGAEKLRCEGLDLSPLDSNSWLAGMSDADSNFNIIFTKGSNGSCRVQTQWRLEYSQKTYHGYDQLYWGACISSYLGTTLYSRSREIEGKIYSSFIVVAHSEDSNRAIIEYFNRYPLLSAKHLDYKDWEKVVGFRQIKKGTLQYTDMLREVEKLKAGMNNKRRVFN
jgi:hypothetical protein